MIFYDFEINNSSISDYATFLPPTKCNFSKDKARCPHCNDVIGTLEWLPPYKGKIKGIKIGDLITDGSDFIVSEKFVDAFNNSPLTGLSFSDEEVKLGKKLKQKYYLAKPKYVLTYLIEEECGLVLRSRDGCDKCKSLDIKKIDRIRINESSWNGEDVFKPSGVYGSILVTQRFVDFVKEHEFTNFTFVHQDDYKRDWDV